MTTPLLVADLKRDEGFRREAYRDSLGFLTIGYGHHGLDVHDGECWSEEEASLQLEADIATAIVGLDKACPWWRSLDPVRSDALANMAFNLGVAKLLGFQNMLAALEAGNWAKASAQALSSHWAAEVGARATRIAAMFKTGNRMTVAV